MAGAWCAHEAVIHGISWKEDPSMQIQRRRRESNSDPAKKSAPPDPRLSFSLNPSIHPFLPVSTAFAFYSHIKPPSLSLLCALSLSSTASVSRYLMFLSTLLIPNLHPIQAGGLRRGDSARQAGRWRLLVSTQTPCLIWIVLPDEKEKGEKKKTGLEQVWKGTVLGSVRKRQVRQVEWCSGN